MGEFRRWLKKGRKTETFSDMLSDGDVVSLGLSPRFREGLCLCRCLLIHHTSCGPGSNIFQPPPTRCRIRAQLCHACLLTVPGLFTSWLSFCFCLSECQGYLCLGQCGHTSFCTYSVSGCFYRLSCLKDHVCLSCNAFYNSSFHVIHLIDMLMLILLSGKKLISHNKALKFLLLYDPCSVAYLTRYVPPASSVGFL